MSHCDIIKYITNYDQTSNDYCQSTNNDIINLRIDNDCIFSIFLQTDCAQFAVIHIFDDSYGFV